MDVPQRRLPAVNRCNIKTNTLMMTNISLNRHHILTKAENVLGILLT